VLLLLLLVVGKRGLWLESQLSFEIAVIALLDALKEFPILTIFTRKFSTQKTSDHFVQVRIGHQAKVIESCYLLKGRLDPSVPFMHHTFPQVHAAPGNRHADEFLLAHELLMQLLKSLLLE
jgi:hypothetical protein